MAALYKLPCKRSICCRLQLRPAIPVLQRPQPGLQPSPGVIELSPAQSGTIAHVPNHQHIAEIPDSPGLPQAAALPASHAADGAQQCVAPSASQPSRLRRQVVDSNSEDEAEARPAKRSAVSPLHAQPAAEHRPVLQQADADFEDYGNEPQMDEDMEDADNLDEDIADVSDAEQEYQQQAEEYRAAQSSSPHGANAQPTPNAHEATVDLTGDHTPQAQGMHPAVAACRAVMEEKQLQAIDALHELPFTTLQAITEHAANLPASHFPKTLRLNARLVRTLSKLQFKDEQFRPLDQYTIDVEIQDATDKCQAAIGHQILLPSIGKLLVPCFFLFQACACANICTCKVPGMVAMSAWHLFP